MPVFSFPSLVLTDSDEAAIVAKAGSDRYYSCRRETNDQGLARITLLDREQRVRGQVTKRGGLYTVVDARGWIVGQSRSLAVILSVLSK